MISNEPTFSVTSQPNPPEVHYALSGMIDPETLRNMQIDLYRSAKPWILAGQKFRVLGDMRKALPQSAEVAALLKISQEESVKLGMEKMAILYERTLTKMQFERVSDAVDIGFFQDEDEALAWLRSDT